MSRDMLGRAIAAAGLWAIFAAGMSGLTATTPRGHIWVVTASEKASNRPDLVRAAHPSETASVPQISGGKGLVPEG